MAAEDSDISQEEIIWPVLVLACLFGSMYSGLYGGTTGLIGWIALGAVGVLVIAKAFPNTWNYLFWFGFTYILVWGGHILAFVHSVQSEDSASFLFVVGLALIFWGYGVIAYMIYHMKKIRDRLCGLGQGEGEKKRQGYVPMGLWAAASIMFFVFANLSAYGWVIWALGEVDTLAYYIAGEALAILFMIYALWVPQHKLDWVSYYLDYPRTYDAKVEAGTKGMLKGLLTFKSKEREPVKEERAPGLCPRCGAKVVKRAKECPKCGNSMRFTYCPKEEGIIVLCPHCERHVRYGSGECEYCGGKLSRLMVCPKCGYKGELRSWK